MMMAQKKPRTLQGTTLTFNNAIRSRLSYDPLFTPVTYGRCYQAATPTPSSPVTVQTVSGTLGVCGKNLYNMHSQFTYAQFVDITITTEIVFKVAVNLITANLSACWCQVGYTAAGANKEVYPAGTYTISFDLSGTNSIGAIPRADIWYNDRTNRTMVYGVGHKKVTINHTGGYLGLQLYVYSGVTGVNSVIGDWVSASNVMMISGVSETDFSPYVGMTATLQTLAGIEVASTASPNVSWVDGGVPKYAIADTWEPCVMVDGALRSRKTQMVGIKVLNGTENWALQSINAYGVANFSLNAIPYSVELLCTHFLKQTTVIAVTIEEGIFSSSGTVLFIRSKASQDLASFKSWLAAQYAAGTPVTVHYILSSSVVTLGDPVLFEAYAPQTNIYTTSPLQGQIKASVLVPRAT